MVLSKHPTDSGGPPLRWLRLSLVSIALVCGATTAAQGIDQKQLAECLQADATSIYSPGVGILVRIGRCTGLIESGRLDQQNRAKILNSRGSLYLEQRNNARAIADFDQVIRINPQDAFAFNGRGSGYLDQKDYARAIQDFDQAIRIDPQFIDPFYNRAATHQATGDNARAIVDYEHALRIVPKKDSGSRTIICRALIAISPASGGAGAACSK